MINVARKHVRLPCIAVHHCMILPCSSTGHSDLQASLRQSRIPHWNKRKMGLQYVYGELLPADQIGHVRMSVLWVLQRVKMGVLQWQVKQHAAFSIMKGQMVLHVRTCS